MRLLTLFVCVLAGLSLNSNRCVAQVNISLDEDFRFVLHGSEVDLFGIELRSESGGLIPREADPFTVAFSNTQNYVALASVIPYRLDGSVTLGTGWDQLAVPDAEFTYAVKGGSTLIKAPVEFGPCELCPLPRMQVGVDQDGRLYAQGSGHAIEDFTFRSPSGSLIPATSAAPFAELPINTENEIQLTAAGTNVVIDGTVTFGLGWSDHQYNRDIEYTYTEVGKETLRSLKIEPSQYDWEPPPLAMLETRVNDDDQFVIKGESLPISTLTLTSPSGSLLTSNDAGAFGSLGTNAERIVTYQAIDDFITLDGEIVLPTKWDWKGRKDVKVRWDGPADFPEHSKAISHDLYPDVPEPGREPLLFTLDEDNNIVITGIGQDVSAIHFKSPTGALRPTDDEKVAPFPVMLENDANSIVLGVLGGVVLDGSFVTDIGPISPDRLDEIQIEVGYSSTNAATTTEINKACRRCNIPGVSFDEDGELSFENLTSPVTGLTFTSRGDHLTPTDLPPGVTLANSSPNEFSLNSEDGFDASDMQGIEFLWALEPDSDVFFRMTLLDGTSFGPFPITFSGAVPEPSGLMILLSVLPMLGMHRVRKPRGG